MVTFYSSKHHTASEHRHQSSPTLRALWELVSSSAAAVATCLHLYFYSSA